MNRKRNILELELFSPPMDLKKIRKQIDNVDKEIFTTIGKRIELVKQVVAWKKENNIQIFDPKREEEIIFEKKEYGKEIGISPETSEDIMRAMIAEAHLQEKQLFKEDSSSPLKVRRKKIKTDKSLIEIAHILSKKSDTFFFLDSLSEDDWNQKSILGCMPKTTFAAKGNEIFIDGVSQGTHQNPLEWIESQFAPYRNLVPSEKNNGFVGGLVGYMGYEAMKYFIKANTKSHDSFYDIEMGLYLDSLVYHRKTDTLEYIFLEEDRSHFFEEILSSNIPQMEDFHAQYQGSNMSDQDYENMVNKCKQAITEGKVFQIVPSRQFHYSVCGDAMEMYKKLRISNPSPQMFFVQFGERITLGSSPEVIANISGNHIETFPIAGTRSRGKTPQEDALKSAELLADQKEVAEHLMLVDMSRNDLGQVCEYGSVKVEATMMLKKYSHVQHLVSKVTGRIKKDISPFQAMQANFPMGTVSGAPRREAINILESLEPSPRGPYSGGVGLWGCNDEVQFALGIRSFFISGNKGTAQAGAGVVYDSVPEYERIEVEKKSQNIRSLLAE